MSAPVPTHPDFDLCIRNELKWLLAYLAVSKQWVDPSIHQRLEHVQKMLPLVAGFPVVLVGEFSAGKSSLINALIDAQVLPSGLSVTTRWTTRVSHGAPSASIRLGSGAEYVYPQTFSVDKLKFGKLSRTGTKEDAANLKRWLEYMTQNVAAECDEIRITWPSALLSQQIVFYDTPGVNSEDAHHRERAHQALVDHAICALFVFPCIGAGRESVIRHDLSCIQQFRYPLFAISKVDLAEYKSQLLDVEAVVRAKLVANMPVPPKKVFLVSVKGSETNDLPDLRNHISRLAEQVLSQATPGHIANELTGLCDSHWSALQRNENTEPTIFRLRALGLTAQSLIGDGRRSKVPMVCPHCLNVIHVSPSSAGSWWSGQRTCEQCKKRVDLGAASPLVRTCAHCGGYTLATVGVCGRCGKYVTTDPQVAYQKYHEQIRVQNELKRAREERNKRTATVIFFLIGIALGLIILIALSGG